MEFFSRIVQRIAETHRKARRLIVILRIESRHQGQGLVGLLIAVAGVGALLMVIMGIADTQTKSLKYFSQKADLIELKNSLAQVMNSELTCKWQLQNAGVKLNSQTPSILASQEIVLPKIYSGTLPTSPVLAEVGKPVSPGLLVSKIRIFEFQELGTPGAFRATLEVSFQQKSGDMVLAPVRVGQFIYTNATEPKSAQSFTGCTRGAMNASCPKNIYKRVEGPINPKTKFTEVQYLPTEAADFQLKGQMAQWNTPRIAFPDLREGEIFTNTLAQDCITSPYDPGVCIAGGNLMPDLCTKNGTKTSKQLTPSMWQCIDGRVKEINYVQCDAPAKM